MVQAFNENGSINHYNYNYVMGAIMAYLVHCNAARNELCYKTRYGNMCGAGEGMPMQRTRTGRTPTCLEIGAILGRKIPPTKAPP
ncbi:hypothetical protein COOONC_13183 [Cooperia oncophora]